MLYTYEISEKLDLERLLPPLLEAEDRLARLDERARKSSLRQGWTEHLLFREACASRLAEGELVHIEDLVLLDGDALERNVSPDLSAAWQTLHIWRRAARGEPTELLRSPRPGEIAEAPLLPVDAPDYFYDPNWNEAARLTAWRNVLRETDKWPPLLAAALAWDAWLELMPNQRGAWRAPLLASLILKARGKTSAFLLPLDTGRRFAKYRRHHAHCLTGRLGGFLEWTIAATDQARKDLDKLVLAEELLRAKLKGKRQNSRLPALIDLFLSRPLVSIPMAAKALKISNQAVTELLNGLGSSVHEHSGRKRYRVWGVI